MKYELEQELVKKYPKLSKHYRGDPRETCMAFGIETNDGWYKILDHLFGYLTDLMERKLVVDYVKEYKDLHKGKEDYYEKYCSYKFLPPQIILDQVKEKYASLRCYYHTDFEDIPEDIRAIIDTDQVNKKIEEYYDMIDHAIAYAEYQSARTCEVTGNEGKLYTKGWFRVLCDEEAIKMGYKPEEGEKFIIENL
jgi:hypothetical protein